MNRKKMMGLLGVLALCLMCLWTAGGNAHAAEQGEAAGETEKKKVSYDAALRSHFKNLGYYLGKSNHCYYTYAKNIYGNRKNGFVIVGLQEKVKEIRIPEKIKGKKVIAINLISLSTISDDYRELLSLRAKSKTKSIVISRYVDDISDDSIDQGHFLINLKKFKVSPKNRYFSSKSGVLFSKDGKILLNYPNKRKVSKYRIPKGVTNVSDRGFQNAYVGQVIMPDTLKSVDYCALASAHIKKVSLSKNLKFIGNYAFLGSGLQEIVLPKNLKSIGYGAFIGCEIKKIVLPKNLEYLGLSAFKDTELQEIVIPGKVKTIPDSCFASCKKLEKVTIKKGVKKIEYGAFLGCYNLGKIIIPSSVKKIENPFSPDPHLDDESNSEEKDQEVWRNAKHTIYVKKESYAHRLFSKKYWEESLDKLGIKVKTM